MGVEDNVTTDTEKGGDEVFNDHDLDYRPPRRNRSRIIIGGLVILVLAVCVVAIPVAYKRSQDDTPSRSFSQSEEALETYNGGDSGAKQKKNDKPKTENGTPKNQDGKQQGKGEQDSNSRPQGKKQTKPPRGESNDEPEKENTGGKPKQTKPPKASNQQGGGGRNNTSSGGGKTNTTAPGGSTQTVTENSYISSDGAFKVNLSLFSDDITRGYSGPTEIKEDLRNAARFLLNNVLNRNTGVSGYESVGFGQRNPYMGWGMFGGGMPIPSAAAPMEDAAAPAPPEAMASGAAPAKQSVGNDVSDYGSNNQEKGVEEGDMIVSDGTHVFAAYGDKIVIWDPRTGKLLAKVQMPKVSENSKPNQASTVGGAAPPSDTTTAAGAGKMSMMPPIYYEPKPYIRHLLLYGDHLMAIVEGYGVSFRNTTARSYPILYDYMSTHIRIYKVVDSQADVLQLVSAKDVNGLFMEARAVDGNVHVVTHTGIDTYTDLVGPFEIYNPVYANMTRKQYVDDVKKKAETEAIPKFVDSLISELSAPTGSMPNLFRVSLMQSENSGKHIEDLAFSEGVVNYITQVYSFRMDSGVANLKPSVSGAFLPTYYVQVYGSTDSLVLCGEGWDYVPASGMSTQSTHLLGVALNGASSTPKSIGKVDGSILNPYSVDVLNGVLRIATTVRNPWLWFRPMPAMPIDVMVAEPMPSDSSTVAEASVAEEPKPANTGGGTAAVSDPVMMPESTTENYIIMLDMSAKNGTMQELGRIQLGKPNEVFTSVRYFDNVAYAVTFERRDPLYVLDLSNPKQPKKISELDITGFSSYLHSMNDDNTLLLGIGQEADDMGNSLGLQVTVYNMANLSDPKVAQRYVIEKDANSYSSSDSMWDFMATRYAAGRLIMPLDIYNWQNQSQNFNGFVVFAASADGIEEECRISHAASTTESGGNMCFSCGSSLPRRSMIFDGNLMTTETHFVRSTDMSNCTQLWHLDITSDEKDQECCGYYLV